VKSQVSQGSDVFVVRLGNDSIDKGMSRLCSSMSLPNRLTSIIIKINMCDYRPPESGAVSDPKVVSALLRWLRLEYPTADICLVENDATSARADILFKYLGFDTLARTYGAHTVNLAKAAWVRKKIDGYILNYIEVPQLFEEADLVVTHPKLKTHSLTQVTCGLKNMFGCFKPTRKVRYHHLLDRLISDINLGMGANLSIVDANTCHEGIAGPAYGSPRHLGFFIGGRDIVAVDAFCAHLAGFRPKRVAHIRYAYEKGLGDLRYQVKGDDVMAEIPSCKLNFNMTLFHVIRLARLVGFGA